MRGRSEGHGSQLPGALCQQNLRGFGHQINNDSNELKPTELNRKAQVCADLTD
jgi:hypothetical protein